MKALLIIVFVIQTIVFGQDFRNSNWGDPIEKVRKAEKEGVLIDKYTSSDALFYSGVKLAGVECVLMYNFVNNKLVRAAYANAETYSRKNTYFYKYAEWALAINEKYGFPEEKEVNWYDNTYRNDIADYGLAISLGHVEFYSIWRTKTTKIMNKISGDNFKIQHILEYESIKYEGQYEESYRKKKSKQF